MKKAVGITAGVVAVAVAGWLGTTWYTGKRIQDEEPARLTQLNQELAKSLAGTGFGATVSQVSYDRHFFSSDVRYGIKMTKMPGEEPLPPQMLEVVGHVEHGPFPKGALARGQWMPTLAFVHTEIAANDLTKPVFELTKGVSPLVSDIVLSYNGDSKGTAAIAPFEYAKDANSLKFSGAQMEGSFERQTRRIVGWAKAEHFFMDVRDEDEHVKADLKNVFMDVNSYAGISGIDIGTSSAKIDDITVDIQPFYANEPIPNADAHVVLKDLGYTVKIGENGPSLNAQADYKLGQILVNGADFGKFNATLKVDSVDGKAAQALSDIYNKVLAQISDDTDTSTSTDALMLEAVNQIIQLLAANPTLRVDPFIWETTKGQSNLTLAVDLTKPAGLVAGQIPTDHEKLLQEAIKLIELKASVSKPMAQGLLVEYLRVSGAETAEAEQTATEQVDTMGTMAEMFGIAKLEGDRLVGTFRYADNKAELNGEEIPADGLFGSLLGGLGSDYGDIDESDSGLLNSLDPADIAEMLDYTGYQFDLDISTATPILSVDATDEGAKSFDILFNECDGATACSDMQLRATFDTPNKVPGSVFNAWNQDNRLMRAYWDNDRQLAVLEMDVNAFGGIGQGNVEYLVNTFIAYIPLFAETIKGE